MNYVATLMTPHNTEGMRTMHGTWVFDEMGLLEHAGTADPTTSTMNSVTTLMTSDAGTVDPTACLSGVAALRIAAYNCHHILFPLTPLKVALV
jgi:hypothetical protein